MKKILCNIALAVIFVSIPLVHAMDHKTGDVSASVSQILPYDADPGSVGVTVFTLFLGMCGILYGDTLLAQASGVSACGVSLYLMGLMSEKTRKLLPGLTYVIAKAGSVGEHRD